MQALARIILGTPTYSNTIDNLGSILPNIIYQLKKKKKYSKTWQIQVIVLKLLPVLHLIKQEVS